MKILSFELTMPNRGLWNGQWSGQNKPYYVIRKVSDKYLKSKEHFKKLGEDLSDSWWYSWSDGWSASVRVQIIDSKEAAKRRKQSAGFCGYEWMIDSIIFYGEIITQSERSTSSTLTKPPNP